MVKKRLFHYTAAAAVAAACMISQASVSYAAPSAATAQTQRAYTEGNWKKEESGWKHYDAAGRPSTGWIYKESGWYYMDPETGLMKTGWFQDEQGRSFYFETAEDNGAEGRLHTGWLEKDGAWYFMNTVDDTNFGTMLTGWQWIDNACYYLGAESGADKGKMAANVTTPDGYRIDAQGRWVSEDGTVHREKQGLSSTVVSKNQTSNTTGKSESSGDSGSSSGSGSNSGSNSGNNNNSGNNGSDNNGSDNNGGNGGDNNGSDNNGGNGGDNNGSDNNGGEETEKDAPALSGSTTITVGENLTLTGDAAYLDAVTGATMKGEKVATSVLEDKTTLTIKTASFAKGSYELNLLANGYKPQTIQLTVAEAAVETTALVNEHKTKIVNVDSMGKWVSVVYENGFNADNTIITVDGEDVTSALTKVTDDGTIAKLPLVRDAASLTVTAKDDSAKTQTVKLGDSANTADESAVYTGDEYLPEKYLTHGAIPVWDYYLTNYDDEGNIRVTPSKTTITTGKVQEAHPGYSPDAEIDTTDKFNPKGTVTIMFNYNTDEEKQWFDSITGLELVAYNENRNTLNGNLDYTVEKDIAHGQGKIAELKIPFNQANFTNNGRYYVRVRSSAGSSSVVSIHVVNDVAPVLKLKESAVSGKNLHFEMQNMIYGITEPVERVTLTDPTGDTKELNMIDDWYLIGDLFVLYNDETAENGRNNLPYKGEYTITVYSNGFKTISKKFVVENGKDAPKKVKAAKAAALSLDAVSRATSSGGGSGSGDGGSSNTSADLVFDTDLLVNAMLLNDLGEETDASAKIVDYWYNIINDAVYNDGETVFYDWTDYIDAVETAKHDGRVLPFAEYKENGQEDPNRPYAVKEVLEDGLLGDIQYSDSYGRLDAPAITVQTSEEGNDVVLAVFDKAYLGKVKALYLNGDWKELGTDKYTIDVEAGTITIKAGVLPVGEDTVLVDASGYKSQLVKIEYKKVNETNLSLRVNYPDGEDGFAVDGEDRFGEKAGTAVFTVENSEGDFLKNVAVTGGVYLVYKDADGIEKEHLVSTKLNMNSSEYYEISDDYKTITIHDVKPGEYTLKLVAQYYDEPLTAAFKVNEAETEPEQPDKTAPEVVGVELVPASYLTSAYYRFSFANAGKELNDYLEKLKDYKVEKSVKVGETNYKYDGTLAWTSNAYRPGEYGGYYAYLDLMTDGFSTTGNTTVTVEVDGYTTLTFTVDKDGKLVNGETTPDKTAPELTGNLTVKAGEALTLESEDAAYLEAITSVSYTDADGEKQMLTANAKDGKLVVETDALAAGAYTLTVEATGYTSQTVKITVEEAESGDKLDAPEVAEIVLDESKKFYKITFNGDEKAISEYLKRFDPNYNKDYSSEKESIKVGEHEYKNGYFLFMASHAYSVNVFNDLRLELTKDGFSTTGDTVVTITADGYTTLTFTVDKDGKLVTGETAPEIKEALAFTGDTTVTAGEKLTLENEDADYLKAIKTVSYADENDEAQELNFTRTSGAIELDTADLAAGTYELTVEADGYEKQTVSMEVTANEDGDVLPAPEFQKVTKVTPIWYFDPAYYRVSFKKAANDEIVAYLKAVEKSGTVEVDGTRFELKSLFSSDTKEAFKIGKDYNASTDYIFLDLTNDIVKEGSEVTVNIIVEGYEDVEFTIAFDEDGNIVTDTTASSIVPAGAAADAVIEEELPAEEETTVPGTETEDVTAPDADGTQEDAQTPEQSETETEDETAKDDASEDGAVSDETSEDATAKDDVTTEDDTVEDDESADEASKEEASDAEAADKNESNETEEQTSGDDAADETASDSAELNEVSEEI